jgi:hypothetical protein
MEQLSILDIINSCHGHFAYLIIRQFWIEECNNCEVKFVSYNHVNSGEKISKGIFAKTEEQI